MCVAVGVDVGGGAHCAGWVMVLGCRDVGGWGVFQTVGRYNQDFGGSSAPGYYGQACGPGCLPDGEPNGPFESVDAAIFNATDY